MGGGGGLGVAQGSGVMLEARAVDLTGHENVCIKKDASEKKIYHVFSQASFLHVLHTIYQTVFCFIQELISTS